MRQKFNLFIVDGDGKQPKLKIERVCRICWHFWACGNGVGKVLGQAGMVTVLKRLGMIGVGQNFIPMQLYATH